MVHFNICTLLNVCKDLKDSLGLDYFFAYVIKKEQNTHGHIGNSRLQLGNKRNL